MVGSAGPARRPVVDGLPLSATGTVLGRELRPYRAGQERGVH